MGLNLSDHQKTMLTHMGLRLDFLPAHPALLSPAPETPAATPQPLATQTTGPSAGRATAQAQDARGPSLKSAPAPALSAPRAPLPAMRYDIAQLDWTQLQQSVRDCTACGLCQTRKQTVFGVGSPPKPGATIEVMIVGEAPGENEDLQGEPFVGAAGQLLDQMLMALGLSRQPEGGAAGKVFIANVLKCRPPGNRNPNADEVAQCWPFLHRQIELVQPKLLLAMGRFGAQALLASTQPAIEGTPLGKLRGVAYSYLGIPVVVTYHPAYLLRSPAEKGKVWADLCWAQSLVNGA